MDTLGEGDWSDEIEKELGDAIAEAIDDFGPDLDEEGNPIEEGESDRITSEEERERGGRTAGAGEDASDDEGSDEPDESGDSDEAGGADEKEPATA